MTSSFRNAFGATLLGLAAVAAAPTAAAAIVTGSWDPALPAAFGSFGWTATINVKVAQNCGVGTQALSMVNFLGVSFGCNGSALPVVAAFEILTAEVGIYDLATNVIQDVMTFDPSSFNASLFGQLGLGANGDILFLSALTASNVLRSELERPFAYANGCQYDFRLALPGANPAVQYRHTAGIGEGCAGRSNRFTTATNPVEMSQFSVSNDPDLVVITRTALRVGDSVFRAVPEPGSLALALLALGAAGAAASRRTRRRESQAAVAA